MINDQLKEGGLARAKVLAQLKAADALLATEEQWCQNNSALDSLGQQTPPTADNAVKWCASGALRGSKVDSDSSYYVHVRAMRALDVASTAIFNRDIIEANDAHPGTFVGIKAIYKGAIRAAEDAVNG